MNQRLKTSQTKNLRSFSARPDEAQGLTGFAANRQNTVQDNFPYDALVVFSEVLRGDRKRGLPIFSFLKL